MAYKHTGDSIPSPLNEPAPARAYALTMRPLRSHHHRNNASFPICLATFPPASRSSIKRACTTLASYAIAKRTRFKAFFLAAIDFFLQRTLGFS